MQEDTIISELRKIRKEIESECGNDPDRIFEQAVERQKRYAGKLVSPPSGILKKKFLFRLTPPEPYPQVP